MGARRPARLIVGPLCLGLVCACYTAESVEPARTENGRGGEPGSGDRTVPADARLAQLRALIEATDQILVATLQGIDNRAAGGDGFFSTLTFAPSDVLKGPRPAAPIRVRFRSGYNESGGLIEIADATEVVVGRPGALRVGQSYLLFLSRSAYEQNARDAGGAPLPGHTQARQVMTIEGGRAFGAGMTPMITTIQEVRSLTEGETHHPRGTSLEDAVSG